MACFVTHLFLKWINNFATIMSLIILISSLKLLFYVLDFENKLQWVMLDLLGRILRIDVNSIRRALRWSPRTWLFKWYCQGQPYDDMDWTHRRKYHHFSLTTLSADYVLLSHWTWLELILYSFVYFTFCDHNKIIWARVIHHCSVFNLEQEENT